MADVTGRKDFVAFGEQGQREPDPQPKRVVMVSPDGRTVQVMSEDMAEFAERGFVLADQRPEPAVRPKRAKAEPEEASG